MTLDKSKMSTILGALSTLPVIVSGIVFFALRGPNADVYLIINIFGILSIIGVMLAVISIFMSISSGLIRKLLFGLVGLSANIFVLFLAYLLLLAMGIGEA